MRRWLQNILKHALPFVIGSACVVAVPNASAQLPARDPSHLAGVSRIGEHTVRQNDSTTFVLKLAYDTAGDPSYFFSNLFTPVCFTDVCKPVYIDLYWDLLGNYTRYEIPESEPLTKTDHREFDEDDYTHLHRILSNPQSLLKEFTIYELVDKNTYNLTDSVDAVTGATPKTIRNEVIAGAVYTCFTIWHIVYGKAVDKIREITESRCDSHLLRRFLASNNHHYEYWAIDKVVDVHAESDVLLDNLLNVIGGSNIFTAQYALKKYPSSRLAQSDSLQTWLWSVYQSSHYSLQMAILRKLEEIRLLDELSIAIARQLSMSNEEQFTQMLQLLTDQERLPDDALLLVGRQLKNPNPILAEQAYAALSRYPVKNTAIKKQLKQYKRSIDNGS